MRKMQSIFLVSFLLFPGISSAYEYVLVKGKGLEVCEEYGRNLNGCGPNRTTNYKRKICPDAKGFSKPEWLDWDPIGLPGRRRGERLFPEDSQELFDKIDIFLWERDINPFMHVQDEERRNWRGTKKEYKKAWKKYKIYRQARLSTGLPIGRLDIDNDGKPENIVYDRFSQRGVFIVLTADKKDIDLKKTANLLQHPPRKTDAKWEFVLDGSLVYVGGGTGIFMMRSYIRARRILTGGRANVLTFVGG